jgi:hypothetical protein
LISFYRTNPLHIHSLDKHQANLENSVSKKDREDVRQMLKILARGRLKETEWARENQTLTTLFPPLS